MHPTNRNRAKQTTLAIAAALALAACATLTDTPPANPQSVVDERVRIMKSFGAALGAANNYGQGKATVAEAKAKLAPARASMERIGDLFPRGTALGDRGVTQSRALSTIFTNRSDFADKMEALAEAFATLDGALARNAKAEAASAVGQVRNACNTCHTKYRAPED
jgi:cytochrome c556